MEPKSYFSSRTPWSPQSPRKLSLTTPYFDLQLNTQWQTACLMIWGFFPARILFSKLAYTALLKDLTYLFLCRKVPSISLCFELKSCPQLLRQVVVLQSFEWDKCIAGHNRSGAFGVWSTHFPHLPICFHSFGFTLTSGCRNDTMVSNLFNIKF